MRMILLLALLPLTACGAGLVVMQNPQTKEMVQCRHDPWGPILPIDLDACVSGYAAAGWKAMGQ